MKKFYIVAPFIFLILSITYLLASWILSYLIDVRDIFGISTSLYDSGDNFPFIWYHLFREGSPTEILQWILLSLTLVLSSLYIGLLLAENKMEKIPLRWTFLTSGLLIMTLEDTGNIRHKITDYAAGIFNLNPGSSIWKVSIYRSIIEIACYALLGTIMLIAFVLIIRAKNESKKAKIHLFVGFFSYALASSFSATRNIDNWYRRAGTQILLFLDGGRMSDRFSETLPGRKPLGFWFMDFIIEESFELIGAAFILTAVILFARDYIIKSKLSSDNQQQASPCFDRVDSSGNRPNRGL